MAEPRKPAARSAAKKTTTRKTTARKTAPKKAAPAPKTETQELIDKTITAQEAKVATYNALKEKGLPIPADLRAEVEAAQPQEAKVQVQRYVRNGNTTLFRFKLSRHSAIPGHRGIVLQARGNRGDLAPIDPEDLNDPILQANLANGYIELLTYGEAQNVVEKQTHNQQAQHPAIAALRNEKGEKYAEDAVRIMPSNEEVAITVAQIKDGQIVVDRGGIQGRVRERGDAPGAPDYVVGQEPGQHRPANEPHDLTLTDIRRQQAEQSRQRSIGGNPAIISDGFQGDK